jgi:N,N-dimethylformamidase beta subunit-like protein
MAVAATVVVAVAVVAGALVASHGNGHGRPATIATIASTTTTGPASTTTTTAPGGVGGPTAAWVRAENALPGTADWALTKPALSHQIEGYANQVSIDRNGSVNLYVSTTAPSYVVQAYRMGWYGGLGARLVWTSGTQAGTTQSEATITPGVNTVEEHWTPSLAVVTAGWPPGDYLFKLVASTGWQSYIPLTIRDDASEAAFVINNSVTTWQAYNLFGGYDLYAGPKGYASRARIVSFDRPYTLGTGSGDFLGNEFHMVELVESLGLDITYVTSLDVDEHPELLLRHKAFVSLGHDEYYSLVMRNALQAARDAGVNLMFLGANAIYRHIRFAPSPLGPDRHEIDYKDATADPLYGKDNADVTPVAWRDPPNDAPENAIVGDYYQCNPVKADMVITDPTGWVFAGTGVTQDLHLVDVVGSEYDHYTPAPPAPQNITILARSPLVCQHQQDYSDMTYYTAPSGGGVFATGTNLWIPLFNPGCALPCSGTTLIRVTENVLAAFGSGPAGRLHPSVSNLATVPTYGNGHIVDHSTN